MLFIKNYPSPIAGLSLGIGSLGIVWSIIFPDLRDWAINLSLIFAILLILPLFLKIFYYPLNIYNDMQSPLRGSLFPTLPMTTMIIGFDLMPISHPLGYSIWGLGVICHLLLIISFIYFMIRDFNLKAILPSWFVPPVGIVIACVTMPDLSLLFLLRWLFYLGLASFVILLPVILLRLIINDKLDNLTLPSLCILAAPANLCLIGYLTVFPAPDLLLTMFLFMGGTITTLLIYVSLPILLRLPFTPGFSSFTFPLILSAGAMFKFAEYCHNIPQLHSKATIFTTAAHIELLIATALVILVMFHYTKHLSRLLTGLEP